jgi:hypothetical protein
MDMSATAKVPLEKPGDVFCNLVGMEAQRDVLVKRSMTPRGGAGFR